VYHFHYKGHFFLPGDFDKRDITVGPVYWDPKEEASRLMREGREKGVLAPYEIQREFVEAMERFLD